MAEFLVKLADERGRLAQQVEQGYSESEVRERFVQQGYLVYWVKPRGLFVGGKLQIRGRKVKQSQFVIFNQQFLTLTKAGLPILDRKSTRLNSSHVAISYAVFCLKKKIE